MDLMNRISIGNPEMKSGEKLKREVRTVTSLVRKKERRGHPFSYIYLTPTLRSLFLLKKSPRL
jgi:hypothetical protein